jgi:hypothetical protein
MPRFTKLSLLLGISVPNCYAFFISPVRATYPTNLSFLDLTTPSNVLQSAVTTPPLSLVFQRTPCSETPSVYVLPSTYETKFCAISRLSSTCYTHTPTSPTYHHPVVSSTRYEASHNAFACYIKLYRMILSTLYQCSLFNERPDCMSSRIPFPCMHNAQPIESSLNSPF